MKHFFSILVDFNEQKRHLGKQAKIEKNESSSDRHWWWM